MSQASESAGADEGRESEGVDEDRPQRVRDRLRASLAGAGLLVIIIAGGIGALQVDAANDCGTAYTETLTRNLELLTRPGDIPRMDDEDRYCAGERLPVQLGVYGGIELGLILVAVGLFLWRDPSEAVPTAGRERWALLQNRTVAVLLPTLLLAIEAWAVIDSDAHPRDELAQREVGGTHRHFARACELVPISTTRDWAPKHIKFLADQSRGRCSVRFYGKEKDASLVLEPAYAPWEQNGVAAAKDAHRQACAQQTRLAEDACMTRIARGGDVFAWTRTAFVRDSNVRVKLTMRSDERRLLAEDHVRTFVTAVREGITR